MGYPCEISFNGTDATGATIVQVVNASLPNFQKALDDAANPPPPVNYDKVQAAADLFINVSAQLQKKFPQIVLPGDPLGGFPDFLGGIADIAKAAFDAVISLPKDLLNATLDAFDSLFSFAHGLLNGLLAWMAPLALIIALGACFCVLAGNKDIIRSFAPSFPQAPPPQPSYYSYAQPQRVETQNLLPTPAAVQPPPTVGGNGRYSRKG
jgi:hypothetical protein